MTAMNIEEQYPSLMEAWDSKIFESKTKKIKFALNVMKLLNMKKGLYLHANKLSVLSFRISAFSPGW
jgi:hypothetical protein